MATRYYHECNICGTAGAPKDIMTGECKCGGKYLRMKTTDMAKSRTGQGMYRQTEIGLKKPKTAGYKRST